MFTHKKADIVRPFVETEHTEEGHFYKTESGKIYPSITTVLKLLDNREWYPFWVAKVARDEGITEAEAEIRCEEIGQSSMKVGNQIHHMAETFLKNKVIGKWIADDYEIDLGILFDPLSKHLTEHVNNIQGTEVKLYSDELELAGTADCVAEYDGEPSIVDFKNSRKPKSKSQCKSKNYFVQLCAYGKMWEFCTGQKIKQGVIIVISWDGKLKAHKVNLEDYESDLYSKLVLAEQQKALNTK